MAFASVCVVSFQRLMIQKYFTIKWIFCLAILFRLILVLFVPNSLLTDGIDRYIPDADKILALDFSFWTPPLYSLILGFLKLIFGDLLYVVVKLLNVIFFAFVLYSIYKILVKLDIPLVSVKYILTIFSFLAWPILTSVSIMADMLNLLLLNLALLVIINKKKDFKTFFSVFLCFVCIWFLRPSAFVSAISFSLFLFYEITVKKVDVRFKIQSLFLFALTMILSLLTFLPWLIKNYFQIGQLYLVNNNDQNSRAFTLINFKDLWGQVIRVFEYFWEIPALDKINSLNDSLLVYGQIYYFFNVLVFGIFSVLIVWFLAKYLKQTTSYFKYLILIIPYIFFNLLYWPFFSQNAYWDSGRYSLPILMFLLIPLVEVFRKFSNKAFRSFVAIIVILVMIFSIINSLAIIYTGREYESDIEQMYSFIQSRDIRDLSTNDNLSFIYLKSIKHRIIATNYEIKPSCNEVQKFGYYILCINEKSGFITRSIESKKTL